MIAGIDEAGRGPVIGPMVMAILACEDEAALARLGAKDSKQLLPAQREKIARDLEQFPHVTIALSPQEIDAAVLGKPDNLNKLEVRTTARLICELAKQTTLREVIIDSPTRSTEKYEVSVREAIAKLDEKLAKTITLRCENKADANHPVVGAASILAKVARDHAIDALEAKHGNLGSGYPSDPTTQAFLGKHWREGHEFFRKSWESYQRLARGGEQATLSDFGSKAGEHAEIVREFEYLTEHGFLFEEPTNQYEVVRLRKDKTTVIRYTTGKIVVQGPEKESVELLLKK